MKSLLSLSIIALLSVVACKSSEKSTEQSVNVVEATWNNWSGGLAGIGGVNYTVTIALPNGKKAEVTGLTIDGDEKKIDKTQAAEGKLTVFVTENTSSRTHDSTAPQSPKFRTENPTSGEITFTLDGKTITLPIENFKEAPSKNYQ